MGISKELQKRSEDKCEFCGTEEELLDYIVAPMSGDKIEDLIAVCNTCNNQLQIPDDVDVNHWRCLNESMWSQIPAVQVMSYRMLTQLSGEGWAQDLLGVMYMDDETLAWAKDGEEEPGIEKVIHKDSNGNILENGDSVVLIKDLNVKGANFIAKRGTAVRRIRLVHDNAEHIEGKVDGQHIVILTQFVKKS